MTPISSSGTPVPPDGQHPRRWKAVDLFLPLIICGGAYVYAGFFYPDPYLTEGAETTRALFLLWSYRILLPLLAAGFIAVWIGIRREKIKASTVLLLSGTIIVICLLLYPAANWFFDRSSPRRLEEFHPYLQLSPKTIAMSEGDRSGRFVIFCLGGSTTEFTDAAGKGWPARLEEVLRDAIPGKRIEVYNHGRQWYTTLHTLINYETNLRPLRPDAIIVMQSINDLLNNADFSYFSAGEFRRDYGHFRGPVSRMLDKEGLLTYIVRITRGLWYATERSVLETEIFAGLESYETNLRTIIELARNDSTAVILMSEPSLFRESNTPEELEALYMLNKEAIGKDKRWGLRTALSGMRQYNGVMKRLAREQNLLFIDLDAAVPKSLDYFTDDVHYRDRTFDLVADSVSARLRESALLR
jgi:lysophospholipase L1-like esterase